MSSSNTETVIQKCKIASFSRKGYTADKRSTKRAHRRLNRAALAAEGVDYELKNVHRLTDRDSTVVRMIDRNA
jgi:hypothetical protein